VNCLVFSHAKRFLNKYVFVSFKSLCDLGEVAVVVRGDGYHRDGRILENLFLICYGNDSRVTTYDLIEAFCVNVVDGDRSTSWMFPISCDVVFPNSQTNNTHIHVRHDPYSDWSEARMSMISFSEYVQCGRIIRARMAVTRSSSFCVSTAR